MKTKKEIHKALLKEWSLLNSGMAKKKLCEKYRKLFKRIGYDLIIVCDSGGHKSWLPIPCKIKNFKKLLIRGSI